MPDFDFDTRKPQEPNQPNRGRIQVVANKLRILLIATRSRMVLIANRVQSLLIANRLRTLLIGGGILLFIGIAVPIGLRSYSSSGLGVLQQEAINVELNGKNIALGMRRPGDSFHNDFDYDLYVMNIDGSKPTRLADGVEAAWSSDGKKIAFVRYVEEPNPSASALSSPSPALPNGKKVAFVSYGEEPNPSLASASASPVPFIELPYIFVMNADGSGQQKLLDRPAVDPTWSPDGKEIAFSYYLKDMKYYKGQGYSTCGIYVTNADGSREPTKLKTGPGCAYKPSWSPDGTKIAYTSGQGWDDYSKADIYVVNVPHENSTNEPRPLTDSFPESAGGPSWSPDGAEIAFTQADRSGKTTIYKMDADGSGETPLTHHNDEGLWGQGSPTWSPDGDQIAYAGSVVLRGSSTIETSKIYKMNSDGSSPTLVRDFGKGSSLWGLDWQPLP
jgi:Tol biopolymer transport system component